MSEDLYTDLNKCGVHVHEDRVEVFSDCHGCGDHMTDPAVITALRDQLNELLERQSESLSRATQDPDSEG